jgi:cytochrome c oxidase assembly protein subunit 15
MKSIAPRDDSAPQNPILVPGFVVISALTFCLIVVGALVRANDAGLACPDWPLCHGEVVPTFDLKVAFEWGHRVFAGSISLGLLALSVLAWRDSRMRVRLAVAWAVLATQIVFGGLTVLLSLAPWTVGVHLVLGNFFCVILLWISQDLAEEFGLRRVSSPLTGAVFGLLLALAASLFFQMVLGGWLSSHYAGLACIDFPTCDGESFVPTLEGPVGIQVLHRLNGLFLLCGYGVLAFLTRRRGRAGTLAGLGCALVLAQIGVGAANVLLQLPIAITALHSGLAAAIVLVTAMLVREALGARGARVETNPEARMVEVG